MGIANRTDFDLRQHAEVSGKSLTYFDEERKEHVVPYVIEPAAGVDRSRAGLPGRRLPRGGRAGREAGGAPPAPRAGAGQDRRAAPAQEARGDRRPWPGAPRPPGPALGRPSTTTRRPSAASTAGRTRWGRRTASRWTCRRSAIREQGRGGRRPRDDPRPRLDGADPGAVGTELSGAVRASCSTSAGSTWRERYPPARSVRAQGWPGSARTGARRRAGAQPVEGRPASAAGQRPASAVLTRGRRQGRRAPRTARARSARRAGSVPRTNAIVTRRTHSLTDRRGRRDQDHALRERGKSSLALSPSTTAHVGRPDRDGHARAGLVLPEAARPVVADPDARSRAAA